MQNHCTPAQPDYPAYLQELPGLLRTWSRSLGFSSLGISAADGTAIDEAAVHLNRWLQQGRHGALDYMAKHAALRANPATLFANTARVISVTLPYLPRIDHCFDALADPEKAFISRYALGRDYHKTVRSRLARLDGQLQAYLREHMPSEIYAGYRHESRVFSDSAPVFEVVFAQQSGLGWRGKHTLLLNRQGSWHFLGEIYTSLPLPIDPPTAEHCGTCRRCLDACPTDAIVAPYQVDARRCISYLTIEHPGPIPLELRPLIGNRIYGCDDCQIVCPWNRNCPTGDDDFLPRQNLHDASLIELFAWDEAHFQEKLAGSPIRRIGHERWLRNIAVALGNLIAAARQKPAAARMAAEAAAALERRSNDPSPLVREHVSWALEQWTEAGQNP